MALRLKSLLDSAVIGRGLGQYVYLLIDPRDGKPFYVGKGSGERYAQHGRGSVLGPDQDDAHPDPTEQRIRAIRARDGHPEPRVYILRFGLDPDTAFEIEASLIDVLPDLTNRVRGHGTERGGGFLDEVEVRLGAPPLTTDRPALLVKLGPWQEWRDGFDDRKGIGFRPGMSDDDLYKSVHGVWVLRPDTAMKYPYAVAVYAGITRGVWEIDQTRWRRVENRWAWDGRQITSGPVFEAFIGELGRRVPERRRDRRYTFGHGSVIAYWP
jgi:uncharacterized protein